MIRRHVKRAAFVALAYMFLFGTGTTFAAEITSRQAETAVAHWLARQAAPLGTDVGRTVLGAKTYADDGGTPLLHVVRLDGGGFVVTPADDSIGPIIAFSGDGESVVDEGSPLLDLLKQDLSQRIAASSPVRQPLTQAAQSVAGSASSAAWAALLDDGVSAESTGLASVSDVRVAPLVQSKWNQKAVGGVNTYNRFTPKNYACGCVATVGAQIMRYHEWPSPSVSVPQRSFYCAVDGVGTNMDLFGGTYAWQDMPFVPDGTTTDAQRDAISKVARDVGVAVHMRYSSSSSDTHTPILAAVFTNLFGYANACAISDYEIGVDRHLPNAVLANLDAGYPVGLSIKGSSGGHAVVADGYGYYGGLLYLHLNMGWSGNDDVWYNLPVFDTTYYAFSILRSLVFNVFPQGTGEIISGRVTDANGNPLAGVSVSAYRVGGGVLLAPGMSDAHGVYAVSVPDPVARTNDTWKVVAFDDVVASTQTVDVVASASTLYTYNETTGTYSDPFGGGTVGNRWGVDFVFSDFPVITTSSLPSATVGVSYRATLAATGGRPPYRWEISSGSLPSGLTLGTDGTITGTPAAAGNFSVEFRVLNHGDDLHATVTLTLTVSGPECWTYNSAAGTVSHSSTPWVLNVLVSGSQLTITSVRTRAATPCRLPLGDPVDGGYTIVAIANAGYSYDSGVFYGSNVTSPGYYISALTLPDSLTSIGFDAFYFCKNLVGSVSIPDQVTSVGSYAFAYSGFTTLSLGKRVSSIGGYAFYLCPKLSGNLDIPDSVASIGANAFVGNARLTSLSLGSGLRKIEIGAFSSCSGLTSVQVKPGVYVIAAAMFRDCSKLASIAIPESVASIGTFAFQNCTQLTRVEYQGGCPSLFLDLFGSSYSEADLYQNSASVISYVPFSRLAQWQPYVSGDLLAGTAAWQGRPIRLIDPPPLLTVTFEPQGGSVPTPAATLTASYGFAYGTLPSSACAGYIFGGWRTASLGGSLVTDSTLVATNADHTLYASWVPATYTVAFNAQDGTVTPALKTVTYGTDYGALPTPARAGYTFAGWWTTAGGSGSQITASTVVASTSDQTLYASWAPLSYTVVFNTQGGVADPISKSVTFDAAYGTLPTPVRTGYSFAGWWTSVGGAGSPVTDSTAVVIAADHTLYAAWSANAYTVTFDAQNGAVEPANKSVTFNAAYGTLPTPARVGYAFVGWWTGASGAGFEIAPSSTVTVAADHSLYAKWTVEGSAARAIVGRVVTLTVKTTLSNTAWSCVETLPVGLMPLGLAGPGASWNSGSRTITWSDSDTSRVTLRYGVTGVAGDYTLAGVATFNGTGYEVSGDTLVSIAHTPAWAGWRYPRADRAGTACSSERTTVPVTTNLVSVFTLTNAPGDVLTGDVDGDGALELVMADGVLRLHQGDGQQKRFVSLPQACFASMLEDVDGDGILDIGLGSGGAGFSAYFYNGWGDQLRAFPGLHSNGADATVAPVGVNGPTLLMGYNALHANALPRGVACFDWPTASERWYAQVGPTNGNAFSVADADGDGDLDVTMRSATVNKGVSGSGTTDGDMYLVSVGESGSVNLAQKYAGLGDGVADHVFSDLNGDGVCEILGFESHDAVNKGTSRMLVYAADGTVTATFSGPANAGWTYAVGDLAGDRNPEIIATATSGEKTYLLDSSLNKLLEKSGVGYVKLLCDLDGDGVLDIVTQNDKGLLRVLDARLNVVASIQAGSKMGTVIASDINGDGVVDILCRSDKLYVFAFRTLPLPRVVTFSLDKGRATTADRVVTLNNACSNAPTLYMASESPNFAGAEWQWYAAAPSFTLSDGAGDKTVYFKVRNAAGDSAVVSESLSQTAAKPAVVTLAINAGAAGAGRRRVTLDNACSGVPSEYQASTVSTLTGALWKAYSTAPAFDLPAGIGAKTVYFRVRNAFGMSATKNDTITLDESGAQVAATASPAAGGTVTPSGGLAYAGKPLTLTAKAATGWVFTGWDNGRQAYTRSVVATEGTDTNGIIEVKAFFMPLSSISCPSICNPGAQTATVGVAFSLPLSFKSDALPTLAALGLPTGLKYDAAKQSIVGVPTKGGTNVVTLTLSNAKGAAVPQAFALCVAALPTWAQGTFNGLAGLDPLGSGVAALTVSSQGAISGKLTLRGSNFTFTASSYASLDQSGTFWLTSTAKVSRAAIPLTLAVTSPAANIQSDDLRATVSATLGKADGALGDGGWLTLYRNVWKGAGMSAFLADGFTGYYTAALPGGSEFGSGYLTFTADSAGGVKTVGKLADGTAVSLSGSLVLDEDGRVWTALYTAPTAYKGGGLFGVAEWFKPDDGGPTVLNVLEAPFDWTSLSPLATANYGEGGFARSLELVGGWYDKVGNLYGYYRDRALSVSADSGAQPPALTVGTESYDSVWWNPSGTVISAVTNTSGVLTGLVASKAAMPVKVDGKYDYATPTNVVGLTLSLTRATGIFTGSFKAWFDYSATHVSKTLTYEGVLTPVRALGDEEGRGFFLYAGQSAYETAAGATVKYTFNWSYDFLLLGL